MRVYWQSTSLGRTIIATMFAVAIREWPLAPASVPAHWNGEGSIEDYLSPPALLLIAAALGICRFVLSRKFGAARCLDDMPGSR